MLKDGEMLTSSTRVTTSELMGEVVSKSGKPGGWPNYFSYGINADCITISLDTKDLDKKAARRLDPWGLAFLAEVEVRCGITIKHIKFVIDGPVDDVKHDNRLITHLEAFRRRVSFLSINNQYLRFEIIVNKEPLELDGEISLFNRPQNEVIRESFNRVVRDNQSGRLEKDFQTWLFANDVKDVREKAANTNERLAVLGEDFFQLKKKELGIIREFPTGVFNEKVSRHSRILPTEFVDVVTLNKFGDLAVIELKLNDSQLEVIAQLLDYSLFFRCYRDKIIPILKSHLYAIPNDRDIVCYIVNNYFHPKFDKVMKYYSTKGKTHGFRIKKVVLGHYTE